MMMDAKSNNETHLHSFPKYGSNYDWGTKLFFSHMPEVLLTLNPLFFAKKMVPFSMHVAVHQTACSCMVQLFYCVLCKYFLLAVFMMK